MLAAKLGVKFSNPVIWWLRNSADSRAATAHERG